MGGRGQLAHGQKSKERNEHVRLDFFFQLLKHADIHSPLWQWCICQHDPGIMNDDQQCKRRWEVNHPWGDSDVEIHYWHWGTRTSAWLVKSRKQKGEAVSEVTGGRVLNTSTRQPGRQEEKDEWKRSEQHGMLSNRQSKAEWEAGGVDVSMIQQNFGRGEMMKGLGQDGRTMVIEGEYFAHLISAASFHYVIMVSSDASGSFWTCVAPRKRCWTSAIFFKQTSWRGFGQRNRALPGAPSVVAVDGW